MNFTGGCVQVHTLSLTEEHRQHLIPLDTQAKRMSCHQQESDQHHHNIIMAQR